MCRTNTKSRLSAPMQGAYLLWDPLLLSLSSQQPAFTLLFTSSLFAEMSQCSPRADQDPAKEAMHLWLLHIACSDIWDRVDLPSWLMKQCCLHPGYWSYKTGQALLEEGDNEFFDAWADLLEASAVRSPEADDTGMDADVASGDTPRSSNEGRPAAESQSWRIALMPPSLPIGVV